MTQRDQVFGIGAEHGAKKSALVSRLGGFFGHDDLAVYRRLIAKPGFDHRQVFGGLQQHVRVSAVTVAKTEWRPIRETVVRNDTGHLLRILSQHAKQLLGQVSAAMARTTDDQDETEAAVKRIQFRRVPGEQRGKQLIGAENHALADGMGND